MKHELKTQLISVFKSCLDILRDSEGITGEKALRNMSYLLILKLIEPRLGNEIDIDNYPYELDHLDVDIDKHKNRLLEISRFSNLIKENPEDVTDFINYLWEDILSVHPSTKGIFLPNKSFDIRRDDTFQKLFKKIDSLDLVTTPYDTLGNAYEEVIQDIMTGKVFGQFFTQPRIKNMMIKLIDPVIRKDGTIESCADPTMGTGGFLITYLQDILKKAKDRNITPDWNNIKSSIYGKEIEPDTYQLAVSNMLISSGHMFELLDRGDSIREPITRKFDCVLANPPFGIKGLKYDSFNYPLKSSYVPIKSDNAVSLFIQAIIHMLKVGGRAAVVLPDGQDIFGKSKRLVLVREYLLRTCDLVKVICLPAGIFTYTSIKTCVFYFVKKVEGDEILNCVVRHSKTTKKETGRTYKFTGKYNTDSVEFCKYNPVDETHETLVTVGIGKISENNHSLNYNEYIIREEVKRSRDIKMMELGEICTFSPKSKRKASHGEKTGKYPFFKSSMKVNSYVDTADYETESLIIGDGGEPNINYGTMFSVSDHCYVIQCSKSDINLKYVYYYIRSNLDSLNHLYTGVGIKNISKKNIQKIVIPMPSIEIQNELVKDLDDIIEINQGLNDSIKNLKRSNVMCLKTNTKYEDHETMELGEVCELHNGKNIVKSKLIDGEYPVVGGGKTPLGYHNDFNVEANTLIISKDGAYAGYVSRYNSKVFVSNHGIYANNYSERVVQEYIYHCLKLLYQDELYKLQTGAAQPGVNKMNIVKIKIPVPSIEIQNEIVEECNNNLNLITELGKQIEANTLKISKILHESTK